MVERDLSKFDWGDLRMRKRILLALSGIVLLFGAAPTARAEVKRVQMRIGGYLCGN